MEDEPKPEKLTDEEHQARAMLMGLRYHHGNGFPMYFRVDSDGVPEVGSMIDANTLESIFEDDDDASLHIKEHARRLMFDAQKRRWKQRRKDSPWLP